MITDDMFAKGKFWNEGPMVVTGCTKVSPGCKNCWSERFHVRMQGRPAWPTDCLTQTNRRFNGTVHFNLNALKKAVKGKPKVISPWNDMYHEDVMDVQIFSAFQIMSENKQHTYLIITKRLERAVKIATTLVDAASLLSGTLKSGLPNNIIHLATMENQAMVDERMHHLLRIPGKRGIIIEPMLSEVDFTRMRIERGTDNFDVNPLKGASWHVNGAPQGAHRDHGPLIHQVILGPENGKGKRYMNEEWAESVKAQCEAAGVPFYRKDKGEGELIWRGDG